MSDQDVSGMINMIFGGCSRHVGGKRPRDILETNIFRLSWVFFFSLFCFIFSLRYYCSIIMKHFASFFQCFVKHFNISYCNFFDLLIFDPIFLLSFNLDLIQIVLFCLKVIGILLVLKQYIKLLQLIFWFRVFLLLFTSATSLSCIYFSLTSKLYLFSISWSFLISLSAF